jgi:hypothetical protein
MAAAMAFFSERRRIHPDPKAYTSWQTGVFLSAFPSNGEEFTRIGEKYTRRSLGS